MIHGALIKYSKRDLNPHSRNGQRILSPSFIPPFEHPKALIYIYISNTYKIFSNQY